eukprot:TRINITY_DN9558_c0_g1_i3.p1 TRINITY_DN9558_c0_g1~~TRINITY_DN9558_c0_g1_i3.p1  ORF type:complete len:101 (+),score=1.04 TRINITY_DN9558_c0_g1_i3:105-407(+)
MCIRDSVWTRHHRLVSEQGECVSRKLLWLVSAHQEALHQLRFSDSRIAKKNNFDPISRHFALQGCVHCTLVTGASRRAGLPCRPVRDSPYSALILSLIHI